jgi:hypothetical protein
MANNYDVNYDDERFTQVETDKNQALTDIENTYGGMIGNADKFYQDQIDASKQWADKQTQLQQEQTDFAIEQIEQQKDKAQKDYLKEQSGAYVDWQKQSNRYGAEAERQAAAGMDGTGFSESSQVSMYNAYQNRVATSREVIAQAMLNYDNGIKDARLQGNAVIAEIHASALKEQLALALEGFQYENQLILDLTNKKIEVDNTYHQRYLDVLSQINHENAMAEEIRQFNQTYDLQLKQYNESVRQFNKDYDMKVKQYNESIRQFNEEIARLKKKDDHEAKMQAQELELKKKQVEQEKKQWEEEMKLKKEQLAEEKRQFDKQYELQKAKSSGSSGGSKSSGGGGSSTIKKGSSSGTIKNTSTGKNTRQNISSTPSNPTNNMASIMALGYGPISASKLASLMASGQVTRTLKNGQYYYSKKTSSSTNRLKNMGLSY